MSRRIHYTTRDSLESLAFSRDYVIVFGRDHDGDYAAVVTREGVEYRAHLTAEYDGDRACIELDGRLLVTAFGEAS